MAIVAGCVGVAAGSVLIARFPASDRTDPDAAVPPVWTDDGDFHLVLALSLALIALAAWHLVRFDVGKLLAIGVLAVGALWASLFDFGSGQAVWASDQYAGDELIGIWLRVCASGAVLVAVVWSSSSERPPGSTTIRGYVFRGGPGGSAATPPADEATSRASERPVGQRSPRAALWRWGRWAVLAVGTYGLLVLGQMLFVGDERFVRIDQEGLESFQEERWSIALDGGGDGVHTIALITTFRDVDLEDVEFVHGRLVWPAAELDLCGVAIRSAGDGFVQAGDIALSHEICDGVPIQRSFDTYGLPTTACVSVRASGVDLEHCAPLDEVSAEREDVRGG